MEVSRGLGKVKVPLNHPSIAPARDEKTGLSDPLLALDPTYALAMDEGLRIALVRGYCEQARIDTPGTETRLPSARPRRRRRSSYWNGQAH